MDEDDVSTVGRNVARYRKLAKISADELANRAGNGLTRSIIANLETGRKNDITVNQLVAISVAVGIPPFAFLVDLFDPSGKPDFDLAAANGGQETTRDGGQFLYRNFEALKWMTGQMSPGRSDRNGAQSAFADIFNAQRDYASAFDQWYRLTAALEGTRAAIAAETEEATARRGTDELDYLEEGAILAYESLLSSIDRLRDLGVDLSEKVPVYEARMLRFGLKLVSRQYDGPEFESWQIDG